MADITMCDNEKCSKRMTCYRFTAIPCEYRQAYFNPTPKEKGCDYYWKKIGG